MNKDLELFPSNIVILEVNLYLNKENKMFKISKKVITIHLLCIIIASMLLLSGCNTFSTPTSQPTSLPIPSETLEPIKTATLPDPSETETPEEVFEVTVEKAMEFSVNLNNLATGYQSEIIPAVPASENPPYWMIMPDYTKITLEGYPISQHRLQPQIFIYPIEELVAVNEGAGKVVETLKTLLRDPQEMKDMPFLPLMNEVQVMHTQIQYLEFKTGQGVRYLTEFGQGMVPLNNYELFYTFQGLTNDEKYYVAAIFPVNHPNMPADDKINGSEPVEFYDDFQTYVKNVASALNIKSDKSFTPELTQLEVLISSLEIK